MGNGEFFSKPESWLAIVTAGTALVAIWQTRKQIKLSNKQQLMDRRIENYVLASALIENYESAREELDLEDIDGTFSRALNKIMFRTDILDVSMFSIPSDQDAFLNDVNKKLSFIRQSATEIPIIFRNKEANSIAVFIESCSLLLFNGIVYNVFMNMSSEKRKENKEAMKQAQDRLIESFIDTDKNFESVIKLEAQKKLLEQIKL